MAPAQTTCGLKDDIVQDGTHANPQAIYSKLPGLSLCTSEFEDLVIRVSKLLQNAADGTLRPTEASFRTSDSIRHGRRARYENLDFVTSFGICHDTLKYLLVDVACVEIAIVRRITDGVNCLELIGVLLFQIIEFGL